MRFGRSEIGWVERGVLGMEKGSCMQSESREEENHEKRVNFTEFGFFGWLAYDGVSKTKTNQYKTSQLKSLAPETHRLLIP